MSNKGLSQEQRKAMLDEEMGNGDGEVIEEPPTVETPVVPVVPMPAATLPSAQFAPELALLLQGLAKEFVQANQASAQAIREALGTAAVLAREPIPENKVCPGISVYSHPDGDEKTPRTKLRCPMYLSIYDENGDSVRALEIFEDCCTEVERVKLNELVPGVYPNIRRNDGQRAVVRVVEKTDMNGLPQYLMVAVPTVWLSQEQFQQMPGQLDLTEQLIAAASR